MFELINRLIFGHVQLIDDAIKQKQKKLRKAYSKYQYDKANPYIKSNIDDFDDLFEDFKK